MEPTLGTIAKAEILTRGIGVVMGQEIAWAQSLVEKGKKSFGYPCKISRAMAGFVILSRSACPGWPPAVLPELAR